jgi:hypothetical protein
MPHLMGIIALAMAAAVPAQDPQDWRAVTQTDQMVVGVDKGSIADGSTAGSRLFTAVAVYAAPQDGGMVYSTARWEMDCAGDTMTVVSITDYAADDREIETVAGTGQRLPVPAGSIGAGFRQGVCEGRWDDAPGFQSLRVFAVRYRAQMLQ